MEENPNIHLYSITINILPRTHYYIYTDNFMNKSVIILDILCVSAFSSQLFLMFITILKDHDFNYLKNIMLLDIYSLIIFVIINDYNKYS